MYVELDSRPTLYVHEQGVGSPAIVLLHYFGGSSRTWEPLISHLDADVRVIAPDLRGWGRSDRPGEGYTLTDYADDVQALIAKLGVDRYVLVGHSMGGKIAQLLASRRPEGLLGLVLVAPSPPTPLVFPEEARATLTTVYDSRESIEAALSHVLVTDPLSPALHEQVVADSLAGSPAAKLAWPLQISQEDITAQVSRIGVPTLILSGSADKVDPREVLEGELLSRLADGRMQLIEGMGHLLPLEAPEQVASHVMRFMQEIGLLPRR